MRNRKLILCLLMVVVLSFTAGTAFSSIHGLFSGYPIVRVTVNGNEVKVDVPGVMLKGRTMVPVRFILDALGASVTWDEATYTVSITTEEKVAKLPAPTPTPTPTVPTPSSSVAKVGDTLTYAEWDYKVLEVEKHANLSGMFTQNLAKGKYVVAIVEFKNKALFARQVGTYWVAQDSQGRKFNMDSTASLGYYQAFSTDAWHLEDIGASFSGVIPIVFDVPLDATNIVFYPSASYQGAPATGSKGVLLLDAIQ